VAEEREGDVEVFGFHAAQSGKRDREDFECARGEVKRERYREEEAHAPTVLRRLGRLEGGGADLVAHEERQECGTEHDREYPERRDAQGFTALGTGKCCDD